MPRLLPPAPLPEIKAFYKMEANGLGRGGLEICETEWQGRTYRAETRRGSPSLDLCRVLVAAGAPDMRMLVIRRRDGWHQMTIPSIHEGAKWTVRESATQPVHLVRWTPFEWAGKAPEA